MARINLTHHRKFRRLARALGSPALALGTLELIWLVAYEAADAFIGGAVDVADAAAWRGEPADLVAALVDCGLLDAIGPDQYAVHDLWDHVPAYVKLRWQRMHPNAAKCTQPWQKNARTRPVPSRPVPSRREVQRADAREPDPPNRRVLTRLAYDLPSDLVDEADKADELKRQAAQYRLPYDGASVASALDAVARTRKAPLWVRDPYHGRRPVAGRRRRAR